jgi:hypothetical protein
MAERVLRPTQPKKNGRQCLTADETGMPRLQSLQRGLTADTGF